MTVNVNNRADLLKNKGQMWIFDELAAVKKWIPFTVVDNVKITNAPNPVEIKTPSGITIFKTLDLDAEISCDWYHPGDIRRMELLTRGVTSRTSYDGSTAQAAEKVEIFFKNNNDAFPLPGFDGDKTTVTVNSVKDITETTTYTGSGTDYSIAVDANTGITHITHVSTGAIPLNTPVIVNYDYTPLKSQILKPNYDGTLIFRNVIIDSYTDQSDLTKYRRFFLPNCTIETELGMSLVEIGQDNTSPTILPIRFKYAKPDVNSKAAKWYYIDTVNHTPSYP